MAETSGFILSLAKLFAASPWREKLLVAPSLRLGRQWLDRAAGAGPGFVNVGVITPRRLALDFAAPAMVRAGLRFPTVPERVASLGTALERLRAEGGEGYFTRLAPSMEVVELLLSALEEMELAGLRGAPAAAAFESPVKARELATLRAGYAGELAARGLAAPGMAFRHARDAVAARAGGGDALPLLIMPSSVLDELSWAEQRLWRAWPASDKREVEADQGRCRAEITLLTADSPIIEAREVLRRLRSLDLPLDRAEVVCLDADTYAPAMLAAGLETFGGLAEDLPFTFAAGLPCCHSRPGRLLAAWLDWLENGLPPEGLARMLDDGLLGAGWREAAPRVAPADLADRIRTLPLNGDIRVYRSALAARSNAGDLGAASLWLVDLLDAILPLARGGVGLSLDSGEAVLTAAEQLLARTGGEDGKLDAYARAALQEEISAWRPHAGWPGFAPLEWLTARAATLRVMGLGPAPGRLHIGDPHSGGHTGRECTFILGLDDSRYPGATRQDPVLLDKERRGISPELALSRRRRLRREKAFADLVSRLDGNAYFSYARRGPDQREQFPAAPFVRMAKTKPAAPVAPEPASLVPRGAAQCLNRRDAWLLALAATDRNTLVPRHLEPWYPDLAAGDAALRARRGGRFTAFDGFVPQAGRDFLAEPGGRAVSPSELERLAANPLEYFFGRVLGIQPPDYYSPAAGRWLEGDRRGSLLHDLFREFLQRLADAGETAEPYLYPRHDAVLQRLLDAKLEAERAAGPPRDELALVRETGELRQACRIFLREEAVRQTGAKPLAFEVSLGGASSRPTPWDRAEAVELLLPSGRVARLKGRLDRVDRRRDGGLEILDYKSGRSAGYSPSDPFGQGRQLQPLLYLRMLEQALADIGRPETVRGFAYFFPMPRDEGRTVFYPRAALGREGLALADSLLAMLSGGVFPFTTDAGDTRYSDFAEVFRAGGDDTAASRAKAASDLNPELAPWVELRGRT